MKERAKHQNSTKKAANVRHIKTGDTRFGSQISLRKTKNDVHHVVHMTKPVRQIVDVGFNLPELINGARVKSVFSNKKRVLLAKSIVVKSHEPININIWIAPSFIDKAHHVFI